MAEGLTMRAATPSDAETVLAIIEDGKRSIARFGIDQWQCGYPNMDSVRSDIAEGGCYIAEDAAGAPLGTLALLMGHDEEYELADVPWLSPNTAQDEPTTYAAIHRCATAEAALNRGVMAFMFSEAARIAREAGKQSIRIDTHPGNKAMRAFLTKQGYHELAHFNLRAEVRLESELERIAFELPL